MELTFEKNGIKENIEDVLLSNIGAVLMKLDPILMPYVVCTSEDKNFIQCAGGITSLVIEIRIYNGDDSFKHFVIGKREVSNVWHTIKSKVGPVSVLGNEELTINDAIKAFDYFYLNNGIEPSYNKRNITKQFSH